jgi:hypothetical protein
MGAMHPRLDTASVFERLFEVYRAQFTLIVPAAIIVFLPVAILTAVTQGSVAGQLIGAIASIVATYWLQGMVVQAVRDIRDGKRDFTIPALFGSVTPVLGSLILAGVLASIGVMIGLVLLIVPGLFLLTIWAVIAPVIVLEQRPAMEAFGRSRELVKGNGWQVFGVIVVVFLVNAVGALLLGAILSALGDAAGAGLSTLLGSALLAPLAAIAAAIVYLDLSGNPVPEGLDPSTATAAPAGPEAPGGQAWPGSGETTAPGGPPASSPPSPERPPGA